MTSFGADFAFPPCHNRFSSRRKVHFLLVRRLCFYSQSCFAVLVPFLGDICAWAKRAEGQLASCRGHGTASGHSCPGWALALPHLGLGGWGSRGSTPSQALTEAITAVHQVLLCASKSPPKTGLHSCPSTMRLKTQGGSRRACRKSHAEQGRCKLPLKPSSPSPSEAAAPPQAAPGLRIPPAGVPHAQGCWLGAYCS